MWHQSYMNYNSLGGYSRTRESYYLDFNVLSTTQSSKDVHESSHISDDTWTIIVYSCICVKRTKVFSCLRFQTRFSIETPETAWRLAVQVSALFPAQGCNYVSVVKKTTLNLKITSLNTLMICPRWSSCTMYLLACHVIVTAGESGLRCCVPCYMCDVCPAL